MPRHSPYALLRLNYFLYIWRYTIGSRFSRLNCCVSYLQFKTFYRLWQNCFFLPFTEKPDFLQVLPCFDFLVFSLYFVCHVCHTDSFQNQYVLYLIRFSMNFSLTFIKLYSIMNFLHNPVKINELPR